MARARRGRAAKERRALRESSREQAVSAIEAAVAERQVDWSEGHTIELVGDRTGHGLWGELREHDAGGRR